MPARLLSIMIAMLAVPAVAAEKFTFQQALMGTRFTVVCYADTHATAARAASAAFSLAGKLNAAASDYLPQSELVQLSAQPVGQPIPLTPLLYDLLAHSRGFAESTGGAFDPTVGPLTQLWRETRDQHRLPDPKKLSSARAAVGWQHFTLDPLSRTVTLHRENMGFDLGGIAKGYVADLMFESMVSAGIPQTLIAAGGDIRVGDPPPGRDGWRVALQTFDSARPDEVLILANAAVSTSGDLHQSVEIEGVTYSHILDLTTGLGLTRRIAASVVADEAKCSDPVATAACVLGPRGSEALRSISGVREIKVHTPKDPPASTATILSSKQ